MLTVMVDSRELRLPERTAKRLRGKSIDVVDTPEGVLLKPVADLIEEGRGLLKGSGVSTKRFLELKREEKDLER